MSERIALRIPRQGIVRRVDIPDGPDHAGAEVVDLVQTFAGVPVVTRWADTGRRCAFGRRVFEPFEGRKVSA